MKNGLRVAFILMQVELRKHDIMHAVKQMQYNSAQLVLTPEIISCR